MAIIIVNCNNLDKWFIRAVKKHAFQALVVDLECYEFKSVLVIWFYDVNSVVKLLLVRKEIFCDTLICRTGGLS